MHVDACFDRQHALIGVPIGCPPAVLAAQEVVDVTYLSVDGNLHSGQIVVHRDVVVDVRDAFALILEIAMPVGSVIPLADRRFWRGGEWSDEASMAMNNSSGFNYRVIAGTDRLSRHSAGRAVDINPLWNPMYRDGTPHPAEGTYDELRPGTFHGEHPVVRFFESRGWEWGGRWHSPCDLHHFQKAEQSA